MAVCRVLKSFEGWDAGDHVEVFNNRLIELVDRGVLIVEVPDPIEVKVVEVEEVPVKLVEVVKPVKKGRKVVK